MATRTFEIATHNQALTPDVLEPLARELNELRELILSSEAELAPSIEAVHPDNIASARNLVHYLALRRHDIRDLQQRLARAGLSSLGRSESHVLVTLDRVISMLSFARQSATPEFVDEPVGFREGDAILAANTQKLLGPWPPNRSVRIIVTLPKRAAKDPEIAEELLAAGMNCARINCGRDDSETWKAMAENVRAAERALGTECRILVDLAGPKVRTARVKGERKAPRFFAGDRLELVPEDARARKGDRLPRIGCNAVEIFTDAKLGQPIWFDDGKLGGVIEKRTPEGFVIHVVRAEVKGTKLRAGRGINLPQTTLSLPALSDKDFDDLASVVPWADAIELSFVQREEDVLALHRTLRKHGAEHLGVVLKIEKQQAFGELPRLLLAAMRMRNCGVMIARGDLAVEAGFERMVELQEEILWIAEAAHVPTIWASQVLENLAKEGMVSRAEVTDAAMSARAEAVMLNKGPFIIDAIRTLDDILERMQEHQSKRRPLYRALRVSERLWE